MKSTAKIINLKSDNLALIVSGCAVNETVTSVSSKDCLIKSEDI